jgi:serine/threonine protein kinase
MLHAMHGDEGEVAVWLRAGRVLGERYRIEAALGHGGMALVVGATDLRTSRKVALKVPHAERCSPRDIARFEREARSVKRLSSRHVPRVYESTTLRVDGTDVPLIAFEYLDGSDLATWLAAHGPLDAGTAASVALQTCRALEEAHSLGLVHRDIKPANLFLTKTPTGELLVKVLDFGISRSVDSQVTTGAVLGSPAYMPPERMRPSMTVDARGDLWSVGVVLFEAVTGRLPFASDVFPDLCLKILMDEPPALPGIPGELAAVIRRCLEKQPEDRFPTAGDLIFALQPFAAASPQISVRRHTPRRARWAACAVAIAALVIAWRMRDRDLLEDSGPELPIEVVPHTKIAERVAQPETAARAAEPAPRPRVIEVRRDVIVPAAEPALRAELPPNVAGPTRLAEPDPLASPF